MPTKPIAKIDKTPDGFDPDRVCRDEKAEIKARRKKEGWGFGTEPKTADPDKNPDAYADDHLGLALSGGGIRSATLNLGIIQGLAERGVLSRVDYLSTVSGGGYIGTWLHGVILRYKTMAEAIKRLKPPDRKPHDNSEKDPISFLRKFSSYLAPDFGLLSADFWVILVIWLRNVALNQLILIPSVAVFAAILLAIGSGNSAIHSINVRAALWVCSLAPVILALVVWASSKFVREVVAKPDCDSAQRPKFRDLPKKVMWSAAGMFGAAIIVASVSKSLIDPAAPAFQLFAAMTGILWLLFAGLQFRFGFIECRKTRLGNANSTAVSVLLLLAFSLLAAAATAGGTELAMRWIASWDTAVAGSWHVIAWGPSLIVTVWTMGAGFHIGLMGIDLPDVGREWLSRLGAFITMLALAWAALFALMVFGPWWIARLALAHGAAAVSALGTWIATTAGGVLAGKSSQTSGDPDKPSKSRALDWIGAIAPVVFAAGYLMLVSVGVHAALGAMAKEACATCETAPSDQAPPLTVQVSGVSPNAQVSITYKGGSGTPSWLSWVQPFADNYWCLLTPPALLPLLAILAASVALAALMNWRVDINEFSLHHFYKNRLVRCYLGASRGEDRRPSRLTGFDPCDDFPLAKLRTSHEYTGPYPILNCTINLNGGSELAKKERKGASFVFTPLFTGYVPPDPREESEDGEGTATALMGYQRTAGFEYPDGPGIGTCMGISGAAANPNWGASTSAPLAFLMTVFDVRLGWWAGNTRFLKYSQEPGPRFAFAPLISELFAFTTADSHFVNLSDGGHFENFGVYELVRRKCRFIIIGDGEQDSNYDFESLGGVVRKCRTDFGVNIDIDPKRIRPVAASGFSRSHCVVGTIRYPGDNPAEPGWILYLKASLTGDEPEDVQQYKSSHPDFPQQTTADQFFTESQFESYRRLGLHIVRSAFQDVVQKEKHPDKKNPAPHSKDDLIKTRSALPKLFEDLYNSWYPPTDVADGVASRHAEEYSKLLGRLSEDKLRYLTPQILGREGSGWDRDVTEDEARNPDTSDQAKEISFLYCLNLIQLMENVWGDLHFREVANRIGPSHRGWISVFRYWAGQPIFKATWARSRHTFNPLFQDFFDIMASRNPVDAPKAGFEQSEL